MGHEENQKGTKHGSGISRFWTFIIIKVVKHRSEMRKVDHPKLREIIKHFIVNFLTIFRHVIFNLECCKNKKSPYNVGGKPVWRIALGVIAVSATTAK